MEPVLKTRYQRLPYECWHNTPRAIDPGPEEDAEIVADEPPKPLLLPEYKPGSIVDVEA